MHARHKDRLGIRRQGRTLQEHSRLRGYMRGIACGHSHTPFAAPPPCPHHLPLQPLVCCHVPCFDESSSCIPLPAKCRLPRQCCIHNSLGINSPRRSQVFPSFSAGRLIRGVPFFVEAKSCLNKEKHKCPPRTKNLSLSLRLHSPSRGLLCKTYARSTALIASA
jgi:hypothetical protein